MLWYKKYLGTSEPVDLRIERIRTMPAILESIDSPRCAKKLVASACHRVSNGGACAQNLTSSKILPDSA
jgi:hypothetical protein